MSPRYLLILGGEAQRRTAVADHVERLTGLTRSFDGTRLALLANHACTCIPLGAAGCIVGTLFPRHGPEKALTALQEADIAAIVASAGDALIGRFWGGYVAAIAGPAEVRILRDPSGTFPCYHAGVGGCAVFASDAELLACSGMPISLDLEEVGRQLCRAFIPHPRTALAGCSELLPGFALNSNYPAPRPCWSPWDHIRHPRKEREQAAERLERIVRHCVQGWASTRGRVLLSVSGGLDSSILAACLAGARADTVCLTLYSDDPSGDERPFARALCKHLDLPLVERPYRLEDIDILAPLAPHLPRPRDRAQAIAYERVHFEVAREVGADAFMTGNGGDNVLGYSQSAAPIADRYLTGGIDTELVETLRDVCRQTGCSLLDAARHTWRLVRNHPAHVVRPNTLFLEPRFVESLEPNEFSHPWLIAPAKALPGKAAHIATILRVQPNIESHRGRILPMFSPFLSQPLVEACLAIPSWEWRAGGRDRALARTAFVGSLPREILYRRVKGSPSRFAARLLDHFRKPIRDVLLGGRLAAGQLIDLAAIEQALEGDRPVGDLERVRILELVNCEAWLAHWASRASPAANGPKPQLPRP